MYGENIKMDCGSSSDKGRINEYMSDWKGRWLRRAVLLHQQLCPDKKGYFARNVTIKISANLHSICLRLPSMCVVNLRMNCTSSSDENSINEYTWNKKCVTYGGLCFCISSYAQKKKASLLEM